MATLQTHTYKTIGPLSLTLDVYTSPTAKYSNPSLLYFHGGGLLAYDRKAIPPHIVQSCLIRGWPLISADYRLLPNVIADEVLADVSDAYVWVENNMWDVLGVNIGRLDGQKKGGIIVAGVSAAGIFPILLTKHTPPNTSPPAAIFSIYGIPTFQDPLFFPDKNTSTKPPQSKIHRSQIAHHLTSTEPTTGFTPKSEAFDIDCLSKGPGYDANPDWVGRKEAEAKNKEAENEEEKGLELNEEGLVLLDRHDLYDWYLQEGFYQKYFEALEHVGKGGEGEGAKEKLPKMVIVHGDEDGPVPLRLSEEFVEKYGPDKVQLFVAKGKAHFYNEGLFLGNENLEEFEMAWKALDEIVNSAE